MKLNYLDFEIIVGKSAVQKPQGQLAYFTDGGRGGGQTDFLGLKFWGKGNLGGIVLFISSLKTIT